ncbi:glycosyl hydrolase family 20, catalytic domain-containing protein [Sarocladium implicatum]|nr:glycosyl hydrolase family 20, catalytic domain-containing protein [Sarocladium implicatum]
MSSDLYPHRGFMLDTGRKFFPVKAIFHLLTLLHQYNFNVFHWHIYDAESFPLLWPADGGLTNTSIKFSDTQTYYTPCDIKNVVAYAKNLGISVYPETDMPGHSDIWGYWDEDLVVGKPDLKNPHAQLDIREDNQKVYDSIRDLVSTVDGYFGSSMHHFGGDEVAYIWETRDDNSLFNNFLNWLKTLAPAKSVVLWDDPLTDSEKNIQLDKDWIIQTWHKGTTQKILDKGHRVIVSESDAFYIGNADYDTVSSFEFPEDPNVLGFEVAWFTSQGDDPEDLEQSWITEPMRAASEIRRR